MRRRALCVVNDYTRECLALVADTSLSGGWVARELTRLIGMRGKPHTVVSDNGTGLTSSAILCWSQERQVEWHYRGLGQADAERFRRELQRSPQGTNASTRRCSRRCRMPGLYGMPGGTTITTSGHTRNWAGEHPPEKSASLSGGLTQTGCHYLNQRS
jgi:hypothetical protein